VTQTSGDAAPAEVTVETRGRVAIVTLQRPPVNALAGRTIAALRAAFDDLGAARDCSAAILRSGNDRVFCVGADLRDSVQRYRPDGRATPDGPQNDPRNQVDPGRAVRELFWSIYDCPVPVIAAWNGKAIGAGAALIACCDLVVAADDASIALTEINVGLLGGVRQTQRLVGPFLAKRLFLTGEFAGVQEVYRRGAIETVVPAADLLTTAVGLAEVIAAKSPIAVRLAKESANRVEDLGLKEGYRLEQDYTLRVRRYADAEEARQAALEKRVPVFRWE
jgi:enoyl-CoA hydratase